MFERILVPLDLSPRHLTAVDVAAEVRAPEGEVTLIHVVEVIPGIPIGEDRAFYDRIEAQVEGHLGGQRERLDGQGVPCQVAIRYGDRAEEIVRYAEEIAADLIVLGSHRIDPETPGAGWGTLSYKIGILAPCPVLLVK